MGDFTTDGYRQLLLAFQNFGYRPRSFQDVDPFAPDLIVRHDLDMSLKAALPIAEVEADLGVSATYFLLMRSEMYNPMSPTGKDVIDQLIRSGHQVGLHFDASLYSDDPAIQEKAAVNECAVLEAVIGRPVTTISFHRPSSSVLRHKGAFAGRRHAYEKAFFAEIGYCSDSRGAWHHGHPLDLPALARRQAIQLLTHPLWWTCHGSSAGDKLRTIVDARIADIEAAVAANCTIPMTAASKETTPPIRGDSL